MLLRLLLASALLVPPAFARDLPIPPEPPFLLSSTSFQVPPDAFCAIMEIDWSGENAKHPGHAIWNDDGSWTVDWPAMRELAKQSESPSWTGIDPVSVARALIAERRAGKLKEGWPTLCQEQ